MNASEMLENSHSTIIQAFDNLPEIEWDIARACGSWSVKDIISHLTAYEHVLVDAFGIFLGEAPTPYLSRFSKRNAEFNDSEVDARKNHTAQQVLNEYTETHAQAISLLAQIPAETLQQTGTMSWYGTGRCLNDLINVVYAHAGEHCAQITAFRDKEKQ